MRNSGKLHTRMANVAHIARRVKIYTTFDIITLTALREVLHTCEEACSIGHKDLTLTSMCITHKLLFNYTCTASTRNSVNVSVLGRPKEPRYWPCFSAPVVDRLRHNRLLHKCVHSNSNKRLQITQTAADCTTDVEARSVNTSRRNSHNQLQQFTYAVSTYECVVEHGNEILISLWHSNSCAMYQVCWQCVQEVHANRGWKKEDGTNAEFLKLVYFHTDIISCSIQWKCVTCTSASDWL